MKCRGRVAYQLGTDLLTVHQSDQRGITRTVQNGYLARLKNCSILVGVYVNFMLPSNIHFATSVKSRSSSDLICLDPGFSRQLFCFKSTAQCMDCFSSQQHLNNK